MNFKGSRRKNFAIRFRYLKSFGSWVILLAFNLHFENGLKLIIAVETKVLHIVNYEN